MLPVYNIDKSAWGLMLMPTAVSLGIAVVQYKYKTLSNTALSLSGIIAFVMFLVGFGFAISDINKSGGPPIPPPPTPTLTSTPHLDKRIEDIFPPQDALTLRSMSAFTFSLANWVSWGASSVELNAWARLDGRFVKIGSNSYNYLGNADSVIVNYKVPPSTPTIILACLSYVLNGHRVEAVNFFSNSDGSNFRSIKPRIIEVDGRGELCKAMPMVAAQKL